MLIEAVVLSIIIGWIRGGKLSKLRYVKEKSLWFLVVGVLLQSFMVFANDLIGVTTIDKILTYSKEIILFSFILIVIGIIMNYKVRALWISFIGFIMNFFVMFSNGWKKPVIIEGLKLTGKVDLVKIVQEKTISIFTPLVEGSKYPLFGNIIAFAKPYPMAKIVSIGDIIIGIGLFIFIQDIMFRSNSLFRR